MRRWIVRGRRRAAGASVRVRVRWVGVVVLVLVSGCDVPTGPGLAPLEDLPADLAAITFTAEGRPSVPHVMLELRHPEGFSGFVAVDGDGRPVWYFRTQGSPFSHTRRANGDFVLLDSDRGLVEVTPTGRVVNELAQEARPGRRIHHDVTATPRNTILFIADEWAETADGAVAGESIWEWDPERGSVERRWSAFDHLDPELDRGPRFEQDDWLHANSLAFGSRGNLLLSFHFLDQVVSIAPDYGSIEWRLGGTGATIAVDDPFSGQHTAREVGPDRLLLFDNGFDRAEERYSRAIEYAIEGARARTVWEWRPPRDNWARVISGAFRLPNGNTLVGFGTPVDAPPGSTGPIEVYEVTPAGDVVWHLLIGGEISSMYRATPIHGF